MHTPGKYITRWHSPAQLSSSLRERMLRLYLSVYDGVTEEVFFADLDAKDRVLLLLAQDQNLVGFTTLEIRHYPWGQVVYSGDTVVEQAHWGQQSLALEWIGLMGELKSQSPELPLYWLLLVKGHRTFLYLPVFGKSFWPHWEIDRSDLKPLADRLAGQRFGNLYNPVTGVVEFPVSRGHLRTELAEPSHDELQRPAVQFFVQKNPEFRRGHELVCLCEVEESNMKPLTRRVFLTRRNLPLEK